MNRGHKNDQHAKDIWGAAYDAIPKSVFATVCWHLANQCCDQLDDPDAIVARFVNEMGTLAHNGLLPPAQFLAAARSIEKAGK